MCPDAAQLGMRSQDQALDTVKVADQQISMEQTGDRDYKVQQPILYAYNIGELGSALFINAVTAMGMGIYV